MTHEYEIAPGSKVRSIGKSHPKYWLNPHLEFKEIRWNIGFQNLVTGSGCDYKTANWLCRESAVSSLIPEALHPDSSWTLFPTEWVCSFRWCSVPWLHAAGPDLQPRRPSPHLSIPVAAMTQMFWQPQALPFRTSTGTGRMATCWASTEWAMSANTDRQVTVPYPGQVLTQAKEAKQGMGPQRHALTGAFHIGNPAKNVPFFSARVCYVFLLVC